MSVQNIVNINEANLHPTLEQSMTTPVLFYFWSERSQHCQQLTPVLESLAAQYNGQFILAKVDCDAEQMLASQFGLRAIPTVYLFQNGQPVDGFQGPQPEEAIRALLDKVLPREEELKAQNKWLRPRFSPGYGDFDIHHQDDILRMLDTAKKIGLTMTDSYMLTPTKSVTAIIGISDTQEKCHIKGCEACEKKDCIYRRN